MSPKPLNPNWRTFAEKVATAHIGDPRAETWTAASEVEQPSWLLWRYERIAVFP